MSRNILQTNTPALENTTPDFINLKDKVFAEYNFIYHINDGYSISEFSKFTSKNQLLFKKIEDKILQLNLMMVDSVFPVILADIALDVFLNNTSSFHEYINTDKQLIVTGFKPYREYLKYKLHDFINHLLFSNIFSEEIYSGEINANKIYCLKEVNQEIQYYSIYNRKELYDLLSQKLELKIIHQECFIENDDANICLRIKF